MNPWYYGHVNCPFYSPVLEKEVEYDSEKRDRAIKPMEGTIRLFFRCMLIVSRAISSMLK